MSHFTERGYYACWRQVLIRSSSLTDRVVLGVELPWQFYHSIGPFYCQSRLCTQWWEASGNSFFPHHLRLIYFVILMIFLRLIFVSTRRYECKAVSMWLNNINSFIQWELFTITKLSQIIKMFPWNHIYKKIAKYFLILHLNVFSYKFQFKILICFRVKFVFSMRQP